MDIKEEEEEEDGGGGAEDHKRGLHRQERTFISFSDEATLGENFPRRGLRLAPHRICPITRLPAKYFDPVTELPYANLQVRLFASFLIGG